MELTKEQLIELDNYMLVCGIKHHDVRAEIIDHFANILEQRLEENPGLDFKKEIESIHKGFSDRGFKNLLENKKKAVSKKFYNQSLHNLVAFFRLPKIILFVTFYAVSWGIMNSTLKEYFFPVLSFILIFLGFRLLFNVNIRDTKKNKFLMLDMTMHFFNVFYVLVMLFNFFASKKFIFSSDFISNLFLLFFVLLLFFYWSAEHVFYQNKKLIKKQYSNLFV